MVARSNLTYNEQKRNKYRGERAAHNEQISNKKARITNTFSLYTPRPRHPRDPSRPARFLPGQKTISLATEQTGIDFSHDRNNRRKRPVSIAAH